MNKNIKYNVQKNMKQNFIAFNVNYFNYKNLGLTKQVHLNVSRLFIVFKT